MFGAEKEGFDFAPLLLVLSDAEIARLNSKCTRTLNTYLTLNTEFKTVFDKTLRRLRFGKENQMIKRNNVPR